MGFLKEHFDLSEFNTFKVKATTRFFIELHEPDAVSVFLASTLFHQHPYFVLGGGSNVLFTKDFDGIIIKPSFKGIEKTGENDDTITIKVGAGENWDGLVNTCVRNGWAGIENLSWIPGTVGASPVQNIGAYGVEIMDFIHLVEGYLLETGEEIRLNASECHFSYRNSIFKNGLKNKVLITHVSFNLNKIPEYNTTYPDLKKEMENYDEVTIENIRQAIINIRKNKLPDPAVTGNAGSFFKNPVVTGQQAHTLLQFYHNMPAYKQPDGTVKLSAAWLIEQSGWKGKSYGKAGTHPMQPLILVNHGGASGNEILSCAEKIRKAVMNIFGIRLDMEVNVI